MDAGHLPPECTAFVDGFSFWLSIATIFGIVFSNLPFLYKIYKRKSSLGISPYFLILSVLASVCTTANIICLQSFLMTCCRFQPAGTCFANILGILTVAAQLLINVASYFFFIYYYPITHKYRSGDPYILRQEWKHTVMSLYFCGVFSLVVTLVSWFLAAFHSEYVPSNQGSSGTIFGWATTLGVLSAIFSLVQYVPQLYKTWKTRQIGSLSVPALIIQTPGSFLVCYSLMRRPTSNVTTWIGMLISAALQALLLFICIRLYYMKRKLMKERNSGAKDPLSILNGGSGAAVDPLISESGLNALDPIEIELTMPKTERGLEYMALHPLYDTSVLPTSKTGSLFDDDGDHQR